jgi:squalene synthase HpnC
MAVDHYENFPVASFLLPRRLRPAVLAIYRFARSADDIADEGHAAPDVRLASLDALRGELDRIYSGRRPLGPLCVDLQQAIACHRLPPQPFYHLLDAFTQDVIKTRYRDFAELTDYCRRSANPVGRLLLYLYDAASAENLRRSDAICTSLQLINFWQDVAIDWGKGRVYLPQDELEHFGVGEAQIAAGRCGQRWRKLMQFQIGRTRDLMLDGAPLSHMLPGRMGLELRLVIAGGLRILEKLERNGADVFRRRPTLKAYDWPLLLLRALQSPGLPRPE